MVALNRVWYVMKSMAAFMVVNSVILLLIHMPTNDVFVYKKARYVENFLSDLQSW